MRYPGVGIGGCCMKKWKIQAWPEYIQVTIRIGRRMPRWRNGTKRRSVEKDGWDQCCEYTRLSLSIAAGIERNRSGVLTAVSWLRYIRQTVIPPYLPAPRVRSKVKSRILDIQECIQVSGMKIWKIYFRGLDSSRAEQEGRVIGLDLDLLDRN